MEDDPDTEMIPDDDLPESQTEVELDPGFDVEMFSARVEKMLDLRNVIKERVSSNIKAAQRIQKEYYDKRHKTPDTWK